MIFGTSVTIDVLCILLLSVLNTNPLLCEKQMLTDFGHAALSQSQSLLINSNNVMNELLLDSYSWHL